VVLLAVPFARGELEPAEVAGGNVPKLSSVALSDGLTIGDHDRALDELVRVLALEDLGVPDRDLLPDLRGHHPADMLFGDGGSSKGGEGTLGIHVLWKPELPSRRAVGLAVLKHAGPAQGGRDPDGSRVQAFAVAEAS